MWRHARCAVGLAPSRQHAILALRLAMDKRFIISSIVLVFSLVGAMFAYAADSPETSDSTVRNASARSSVGTKSTPGKKPSENPDSLDSQRYLQELLAQLGELSARAKAEYSIVYDQQTHAARLELLDALRDLAQIAKNNADAKQFANSVKLNEILSLAYQSPELFQNAIEKQGVNFVKRGFASGATSQERHTAVKVGDYLRLVKRDVKKINAESSQEERDLAQAEQEYFNENCDAVVAAFEDYMNIGDEESFYALEQILGELYYYQPDSPAVYRLSACLGKVFSSSNFYFEASERFLSELTRRQIDMAFPVRETIREAFAQGSGRIAGRTRLDLRPNAKRAEMALTLDATVSTRTIGSSRGVHVHSDNAGSVVASKQIYLNPNWLLTTVASQASGVMKSTVRGVNTDRIALLGGAVILNKVNQELPFSERESSQRVSARVAQELDEQANLQIATVNNRVKNMLERTHDPLFNHLRSHTSETRFYLQCTLGKYDQWSAPNSEMAPIILQSQLRAKSQDEEYPLADTAASYQQLCQGMYDSSDTHMHRVAQRPYVWSAKSATTSSSSSRNTKKTAKDAKDETLSDVRIRVHQSGPNNVVAVALAGAHFGQDSQIDDVILKFPGVDPQDVKLFLEPYFPKTQRALDPEDNYKDIAVDFDQVRPFSTSFENNKIITVLRVSRIVVDGKELPPIDVRFQYKIEKHGDSFVFLREEVEVVPAGYQDGDVVSARFHMIRRIFLKRLETAIMDEYVVSPIPISTISPEPTTERRGALIPIDITAKNGWFEANFIFDPTFVCQD